MNAVTGQPRTEAWTIQRVIAWAVDDFRARGIPSPRLDADLLLAHALGVDRIHLIVESQRALAPDELARFRELIKRRRNGEPIAYILGQREFYGLEIRVNPSVLIPRPDTEILVEVALDRTRERDLFGRALDLCTGSGCVAIAFAKKRPTWRVTGVDISEPAVELAWQNAIRLGAVFGLRFTVGDLADSLTNDERFELITANPPYIPSAEIEGLEPMVRDYEPRLALDGGADGLAVARRIIERAPLVLEPGGVLALEAHYDQAPSLAELFEAAGFEQIERRRDYGGIERVVSGKKPGG
jgi:release factor glutamine methyltransferase